MALSIIDFFIHKRNSEISTFCLSEKVQFFHSLKFLMVSHLKNKLVIQIKVTDCQCVSNSRVTRCQGNVRENENSGNVREMSGNFTFLEMSGKCQGILFGPQKIISNLEINAKKCLNLKINAENVQMSKSTQKMLKCQNQRKMDIHDNVNEKISACGVLLLFLHHCSDYFDIYILYIPHEAVCVIYLMSYIHKTECFLGSICGRPYSSRQSPQSTQKSKFSWGRAPKPP